MRINKARNFKLNDFRMTQAEKAIKIKQYVKNRTVLKSWMTDNLCSRQQYRNKLNKIGKKKS